MERLIYFILLISAIALGQTTTFTGNAELYFEYDSTEYETDTLIGTSGGYQPYRPPTTTARISVNPTLRVYNMPMSANLVFSTDESETRQRLNMFSISLNPYLADESVLIPQYIRWITRFDIGTVSSYYSKFTLNGKSLLGGAMGMKIGDFAFDATGGQYHRAVEGSDSTRAAYKRTLYAGRFGHSDILGGRLMFQVLHGRDDENSIENNFAPFYSEEDSAFTDSVEIVTPMENTAFGVELYLPLFSEHLAIEGEYFFAQTDVDVREEGEGADGNAFRIEPQLSFSNTELYAKFAQVDPGYYSLGSDYLNNDRREIGGGIKQSLGIARLSASYEHTQNNLTGDETITTERDRLMLRAGVYPRRAPSLTVFYSPYIMSTDSGGVDNRTDVYGISSSYSLSTGVVRNSLNANATYTDYSSWQDSNTTLSYHLSDRIRIDGWPVGFRLSFAQTIMDGSTQTTQTRYRGGIDLRLLESWRTSALVQLTTDDNSDKLEYGLETSVPIAGFAEFFADARRTEYTSETSQDYKGWRIYGGIRTGW